jgi:hypothetical protein
MPLPEWSSALAGWILLASSGLAAQPAPPRRAASADAPVVRKSARPQFGTSSETVINVPSFAFQGNEPQTDQIVQDGFFFRYFAAQGSDALIAPVVGLPSGVVIDGVSVNNCSALPNDLNFVLWLGDWDGSLPGRSPIALTTFSSTQGCGADSTALDYEYDANAAGPLFVEVFWMTDNFDGSDSFNGFQISFHRIVSPAPASATFNDVPTGHPFFQFIEALAASGITGGCGNGNYCPDAPLTRGQMAVFLSKALGLHWPN